MFFSIGSPRQKKTCIRIWAYLCQVGWYRMAMGFLRKVTWTKKKNKGIYTLSIARPFKGYLDQLGFYPILLNFS